MDNNNEKNNDNSNNNKIDGINLEDSINESGQVTLNNNNSKINLLSIIGEIEGHDVISENTKSTKYEHVLPKLAAIEYDDSIEGILIIINTVGGDVEAGLAIAEMIASLSKPSVSLVLGGSHSIGVPIAVSANHSFIVSTGTMVIHPVRMNGVVINSPQTYEYFSQIQNRITSFVSSHCNITKENFEELMMKTGKLSKDVGTILVGQEAVEQGLIDDVGGIKDALNCLNEMIKKG